MLAPKKVQTMHSTETLNRFVNLRAQGWSFDRITDHLHVSKPTLLDWSRKHQLRLDALKNDQQRFAQDGLRTSHQQEFQRLIGFHEALCQELLSRTLKDIPGNEIETLACEIEQQIKELAARSSIQPSVPHQTVSALQSSITPLLQSESVQASPDKSSHPR
jgi:hypothetical protein